MTGLGVGDGEQPQGQVEGKETAETVGEARGASEMFDGRGRSESAALETAHMQLHRSDGVGDMPESTLKCSSDPELWQVATHLYEGPKRFYRVRWRTGHIFSMVDVSERPYADCTAADARGETYPDLFAPGAR